MKIDVLNSKGLLKLIREDGKNLFSGLAEDMDERNEYLTELCDSYADTSDYVYLLAYASSDEIKGSYYKALFKDFFFPGLRAARDLKYLIVSTPTAADHSNLKRQLSRLAPSRDCVHSLTASSNKINVLCGDDSNHATEFDTLIFAFPVPANDPKYDAEYAMKKMAHFTKQANGNDKETVTIQWNLE